MTTQTTDTAITTWQIDPAHTQIGFSVRHMMIATVRGHFTEFAGELVLDENDPAGAQVRVEIASASVDTGNEQRDAHLRSADFFDAENHPQLLFVSRRVEAQGPGRLAVTGDLTIRGVTREVTLSAEETGRGTDPWGAEKIGFTAQTKIDRKDFGLTWNQALEAGGVLVSDEVKITIEGQASRS